MSDTDSDAWNPLEDDDEPYDWSGDDLDFDSGPDLGGDDDDAEPAPLAEFRQLWTEQLSQEQQQPPEPSPAPPPDPCPRPARHFHHPVLSDPDLVDLICAELDPRDLRSLALVDTVIGPVARHRLFRTVSISTPTRAHEYLALSRSSSLPPPAALDISLADYRSVLAETKAFRALVAWKRAQEDEEDVDWYYDQAGRTVGRQPWLNALYRKLGEGVTLERVEAARRAQHRAWARRVVEAPATEKCAADVAGEPTHKERVHSEVHGGVFQTWPFKPLAVARPIEPVLDELARLPKRLTLSTPLSHYVTPLAPILSPLSTLEHLHIVGAEDTYESMGDPSFRPSPCVVQVRASHCGLVGAPQGLQSVKLEWLRLAVLDTASAGEASGEEEDEAEREWRPERVHLEHVVARPQPATARARPPPPLRFRFEPSQDDEEDDFEPWCTRFLCLDLFTFLGQSTLASLRLVDVHGVVPSTIYLAVQHSGASLRHLELVDVNSMATAQDGPNDEPYVPLVRHVFELTLCDATTSSASGTSSTDAGAGAGADAADLDAAIAERTDLPSPPLAPLHPSQLAHSAASLPSLSLAAALRHCTSLRTLRLTSSTLVLPPAEPSYPPDILDALLEARPPLELLQWRVGAPQGSSALGALEWARFAHKVRALPDELRTLASEDSEVWMALRRSARGSSVSYGTCGVM
ncbi:hypothetical protein JCM9279_005620 [Rhodotorula babjevae]